MTSTILMILALLIVAALVYVATRPNFMRIARTATINAPPERIFPLINNLRSLNTWNPFMTTDPNVQVTYTGPDAGKGAKHEWAGNRNVGTGSIEIVESTPHSEIKMDLHMRSPQDARNLVTFTLQPRRASTDVTWMMEGRSSFISKLICLVFNPDKMIGGMFEQGLADLKTLAEK